MELFDLKGRVVVMTGACGVLLMIAMVSAVSVVTM